MPDRSALPQPLEGVRVFDWTIYGVGPFAGVMLGALGADVIKVEPPGGEPQLRDETRQAGMSTMYINQNLCKRSVTLDLKEATDRARALDLLATCDVFLNNMRPGTPERLGLGYEHVRDVAPGIVYCTASGWGSSGPMAGLGGVDLLAQAFSGVAGITGPVGGEPEFYRQLGNLDYSTSSYIVSGVLEALFARERTGCGAEITLSLLEAAVSVQATRLAELLSAGAPAPRLGAGTTTNAPDGVFPTADGKYLAVSVVSDDQWTRLCDAVGWSGLRERQDLATNAGRIAARSELDDGLRSVFGAAHSEWWGIQLARHAVPHAVVSDFAAMRHNPQVRANGFLVTVPTRWGGILAGGHSPVPAPRSLRRPLRVRTQLPCSPSSTGVALLVPRRPREIPFSRMLLTRGFVCSIFRRASLVRTARTCSQRVGRTSQSSNEKTGTTRATGSHAPRPAKVPSTDSSTT
jgi:crotonobetainyl-CoA:carnitine CoA-transferase CaiB-like acyl-CoA transferase